MTFLGGICLINEIIDKKDTMLWIELLGGFTISYNGKVYLKDTGSSKKVINLIQYLIVHRNDKITYDHMIQALKIDYDSKNPASVLKNLIYRARMLLKSTGLPDLNYIIQASGGYAWNNEIPCMVDTQLFEEYYKNAHFDTELSTKEKMEYYAKAIQLYGGKFLPRNTAELWVVPVSAYYEGLVKECLESYFRLMGEEKNDPHIIQLCKKVIEIDPFDERAYAIMIECYCRLEKYNEALIAYEKITDLLYDELGVKPSEELMQLYEEALGQVNYVEKNLMKIDDSLREITEEIQGAYYCTFGLFKAISRFTLRMMDRTGQSLCIVLFTVSDQNGDMPDKKKRSNVMENLRVSIMNSLRCGDVFARYSPSQYIVMLVGATYENSGRIAQRVLDRYHNEFHSRAVQISYKVKVMERYYRT